MTAESMQKLVLAKEELELAREIVVQLLRDCTLEHQARILATFDSILKEVEDAMLL